MELRLISLFGLILLSALCVKAQTENDIESTSDILSSIYGECLSKFSYTCLQKKVLVFVDRLDKVRSFSLAEGWEIVKRAPDGARSNVVEDSVPITEEDLKSLGEGRAAEGAEEVLHDMLDNRIVSFFEHRALRISFPSELSTVVSGRSDVGKTPSMEISLEEDASEGRLKKKKKLKLKAMLLAVLLLGGIKLIKLMPVLLALIKLKAIKALIFASISLLITLGGAARGLIQRKLALFQQSPMKHVKTVEVWLAPMKGGHGGGGGGDGHGSYGGGGGGYNSGGGGGYQGGGDSYSAGYSSGGADSYSSGGHGGGGGGGGYADSYSVGGGSYGAGGGGHGGGGWASKSDSTSDAQNLAYRAHATP